LPDPADRIRVEPKAARGPKRRWTLPPPNRRVVAGAALAAMMIGIVVNAVALQHGRRVDLGLASPAAVGSVRPPRPVPAPRPAGAVPEPPRSAPTTAALASPPKSEDAIADLLRGQASDRRRLTLAAQEALAGLGFQVKTTGALDAPTRKALVSFEKSRHLPISTDVTDKLVHALKAAEAAN
jgi:hypothetical protein